MSRGRGSTRENEVCGSEQESGVSESPHGTVLNVIGDHLYLERPGGKVLLGRRTPTPRSRRPFGTLAATIGRRASLARLATERISDGDDGKGLYELVVHGYGDQRTPRLRRRWPSRSSTGVRCSLITARPEAGCAPGRYGTNRTRWRA
ncbi:hypothetical protein GCM10010234_66680 [Streptomyces hawaiiensis]